MWGTIVLLMLSAFAITCAQPAVEPVSTCETATSVLVQPTLTKTLKTTLVITIIATTAKDLGTFTWVERVSKTTTLPETLTKTVTACTAKSSLLPIETVTSYTRNPSSPGQKIEYQKPNTPEAALCTVTAIRTTSYGSTYIYIPNGETSTYTRYSHFSLATITSISSGGIAYVVATATSTLSTVCGPIMSAQPATTTTIIRDIRCAPTALTSAYSNFGIDWLSDHPGYPGAVYKTTTKDAAECCQICADAHRCSNSAWNIRNNECRLEFVVWPHGEQSCDYERGGLLGYYVWGPNRPMEPGSGWWIGSICGKAQFAGAKPDDGS